MKTIFRSFIISGLISMLFVGFSACEKNPPKNDDITYASILNVSDDGTSSLIDANLKSGIVETGPLTDSELAALQSLKEEEKLARDVYMMLYEKWGSPVFLNISGAETNHLNAVNYLLSYYGEADTLIGAVGAFVNPAFTELYNELLETGYESLESAFRTGALIEEMDIKDIRELYEVVTNENIIMVFDNLERGSRNHLRAFNRQLTSLGVSYEPRYISLSDFYSIVNSPNERGKQYRMNGNCLLNQ